MPGEKEINVNLFERLDLIERLEMAAETNDIDTVKKQLAIEKKFIERKLYQQPPLNSEHLS
ncbi:hypothetical protein D5282_16210 [bacterium 1xD8-48]|jgi:hypothetical protein|nr:hypothetical protein [Lachnospiraceae bacterium]MCI9325735.1 hypothetical protein [Lachnospiraceae bacterium]NBJ98821.1 hypothetical protein [bacterium 1xD8-48]